MTPGKKNEAKIAALRARAIDPAAPLDEQRNSALAAIRLMHKQDEADRAVPAPRSPVKKTAPPKPKAPTTLAEFYENFKRQREQAEAEMAPKERGNRES
jgi:hypothetical protein